MLEWTGERYLPWLQGAGAEIHYEHLQRYAFARQLVKGKRVVDLGCGEGYGSFLLAGEAASVVGLDINPAAVGHARSRYGYLRKNLSFVQGSMTDVPGLETDGFDVAVCFEVLEHIDDHEGLLAEVRRLLAPGGRFVISTPNKRVYSDKTGYRNPFHVKELYFGEFEQLLRQHFGHVRLLGQSVYMGAFMWGLVESDNEIGSELVVERTSEGYRHARPDQKEPRYFLGVASDDALPSDLATENRLVDVSNGYIDELIDLHVRPQIQSLTHETSKLRSDLEERRQQAREWDAERVRLLTEIQHQESRVQQQESRVQQQESRVQQQESRIQQLDSLVESKRAETSRLSEVLIAHEAELARLEAHVQRLDSDLDATRRLAVQRLGLLEAQAREVLRLSSDSQRLESELEAAQRDSAQRADLMESQEVELRRLRTDVQRLESHLEIKRDEARSLSTSLEAWQEERERLGIEVRRLELALETKQTEARRLSRQIGEGATAISAPAEELSLVARESGKTRRALAQLQSSRSWRLTAPLRMVSREWQKLSRRNQLHLSIDEPLLEGTQVFGKVDVVGWAMGPDPVVRVEVLCDGQIVGTGAVGLSRPDVAFHLGVAGAERSGFSVEWNTKTVVAGLHELTVRAIDSRGRMTEVKGTVEVMPPMQLHVDGPSLDAGAVSGIITVTGWAAGPSEVARIEVLCDGERVCIGHVGLPRPEVAAGHPGLTDVERSGFALEWNTTTVAHGLHVLTVRASDSMGRVVELKGTVEIESPGYLYVDEPPDNSRQSAPITIAGWASASRPVVRVEVLCEGEQLGVTHVGLSRPDVGAAFPHLAEASRSGFELTVDPVRLGPGLRELTVRALDTLGRASTITRRIVVVEARSQVRRTVCERFAVYMSSLGNYFFGEIGGLLCAGLEELGFAVDIRDEKKGFAEDADWHVVVAPHEFFYLGKGQELLKQDLPQHLIMFNTEQPLSQWFSLALNCFSRAHSVWDINLECSRVTTLRGYRSRYLALGYAERYAAANHVDSLPKNYGTCFLEPEVVNCSSGDASWAQRPLDVLFIGHLSQRRERFLAENASTLSRYRCYFHLSSASTPVIPGQTTHLDTATVNGLAQRSKIVLNIHHGSDRYFEWHRIVMQGIWQRALVVTESCGIGPPFESGLDFVEAPLDEISATIDHYLSTAAGRREASTIAEHGYRTLTDKVRLADCLRALILELHEVPRFPASFGHGVADRPRHAHATVSNEIHFTHDIEWT